MKIHFLSQKSNRVSQLPNIVNIFEIMDSGVGMTCFGSVFKGLRLAWYLFGLWSGMESWWMYTAFGDTLLIQLALRNRRLYRCECVHLAIAYPSVSSDLPVAP